jgi:amino acid transporter
MNTPSDSSKMVLSSHLKLGRWQATALAFSFVIGIGILVLPTLALDIAGPTGALYSWAAMTLFAVPLISVFSILGRKHFRAGGISVYCTEALGGWSEVAVHMSMLSALLLAMPGMVWVAGTMFSDLFGLSKFWTVLFSHLIISGICLNNLFPIRKSTLLSAASPILIGLVAITVICLNRHSLALALPLGLGERTAAASFQWSALWKASVLIFFGYVGWESMSLCVRDLKDPEKDSAFVYWTSFIGVSVLYLLLAATVSGAALEGRSIGAMDGILKLIASPHALMVARVIMFSVLIANLNAWVLSGSRQLQSFLALDVFKNILDSFGAGNLAQVKENGVPRGAIALYFSIVTLILVGIDFGRVTVSGLILIANQNWILLYGGVLLFFWKKASTPAYRFLALTATLSFLILASACSWQMAIALAVFALTCAFACRFNRCISLTPRREFPLQVTKL